MMRWTFTLRNTKQREGHIEIMQKKDKRIAILTSTRAHMFDLFQSLRDLGCDVKLLCGIPQWKLDPDLKPGAMTRPWFVTMLAGFSRYRLKIPFRMKWEYLARKDLSTWAARHLSNTQILDALAGWGLEAGQEIQRQGGIYVCNRGSSHILFQKQILEEEHTKWGAPLSKGFPAWGVEREIAEYETANAVVVPSTFCKKTFIEYGVPEEKVFVCPYGVDLKLFHPVPKEDTRFRVIFVGSFSIRKGIGYLFEAMRPLVKKGLVDLWLVGGPSPEAKEILAQNADIFINKGFHPRRELKWFYSQADVLVLPSVEEGLSLVQAQAMACGLPIIATENTGARDLFTDGVEGFIVPIRDPVAIKEKVEWMLNHPKERKEMGRNAVQLVKGLHGWTDYAKKVLNMYSHLSSNGPA